MAGAGDINSGLSNLSLSSQEDYSILPRPNYGQRGGGIKLVSNYFPLAVKPLNVYHYDIVIEADFGENIQRENSGARIYKAISTMQNRRIIKSMISNQEIFQGLLPVFDGEKNLFTKRALPGITRQNPGKFNVALDEPGRRDVSHYYNVTVTAAAGSPIKLDNLKKILAANNGEIPQIVIQVLDIILRAGLFDSLMPIGRSFYKKPQQGSNVEVPVLGGIKEVWMGHSQSVRPTKDCFMLTVDRAVTAFFIEQPIPDFVYEFFRNDRVFNGMSDSDRNKLSRELKNLTIFVTHLEYQRTYKIRAITKTTARTQTFKLFGENEGQETSVFDYFREKYNIELRYPNLPLIESGSKNKPNYIPMEVCVIKADQHSHKLNERQTSEIIKITAKNPTIRFEQIQQAVQMCSNLSRPYCQEYGLMLNTNPTMVDARVLPAPDVRYLGNNPNQALVTPNDGAWNLRNHQFFKAAKIDQWAILRCCDQRFCDDAQIDNLVRLLTQSARSLGVQMGRPSEIKSTRRDDYPPDVLKSMKLRNPGLQLVVVILDKKEGIYEGIKNMAEKELELQTQCMKAEKMQRINPQHANNILLKINVKMGGVNNVISPNCIPPAIRGPIMFVGADVTHPSGNLQSSIAAVVASYDSSLAKYDVSIRVQTDEEARKKVVEIIKDLDNIMIERLDMFFENNQLLPKKIIFFRDGVSEGQFEHVWYEELAAIRAACANYYAEKNEPLPGITYIVVRKRHNHVFKPANPRDGSGRSNNIPAGTVIENTITHPTAFDFFLCSHIGIQGTSRPALYNVLYDSNRLSVDELQAMIYMTSHLYVRCTRSISLPAPVEYSHLAAARARIHLSGSDLETVVSTGDSYDEILEREMNEEVRGMRGMMNYI